MNHGEFEVRGGIVDGNAPGFGNGDQHKRAECEGVHGRNLKWVAAYGPLNDGSDACAVRDHCDGDERKQQRSLGERGNQRFAACAHAAEGTAPVHRAQNQKEAAQRQQIDKQNKVAAIAQQRGCVQCRNEGRAASVAANRMIGHSRKSGEAVDGIRSSLWNSFQRSA